MNIKIDPSFNQGLDLVARLCGYPRGVNGKGNSKAMLEAIARGERFPIPLEWKGVERALECDQLIRAKQPFRLFYKDAQLLERVFSVRFAEIAFHEKRFYLDCWAIEVDDNQDLPELRHNWCFRFDRILNLEPDPNSPWVSALDSTLVSFRLYNGLAKAYERRETDVAVEMDGDALRVDRRISNSFWFVRSILPYGADCEVLAPDAVRAKVAKSFIDAAKRYQEAERDAMP